MKRMNQCWPVTENVLRYSRKMTLRANTEHIDPKQQGGNYTFMLTISSPIEHVLSAGNLDEIRKKLHM